MSLCLVPCIALEVSPMLLALTSLRAITLKVFWLAYLYMAHRSPWISRVDPHLSLSCWLEHLTIMA